MKPYIIEKGDSPVPRTSLTKYPIQTRKRGNFLQGMKRSSSSSRTNRPNSRTNHPNSRINRPNSRINRPSPSESATVFKVGTKRKGNDGNTWVIKENKNGTKRWVKI